MRRLPHEGEDEDRSAAGGQAIAISLASNDRRTIPRPSKEPPMVRRLAAASIRHRRAVLALWLLVTLIGLGSPAHRCCSAG